MKKNKPLNETLRDWTPQAIDCYNLGDSCEGCIIKDSIESTCVMKSTIKQLLELLGEPPEKPTIPTKEEILELFDKGLNFKEIATHFGYSYYILSKITKSYGLNGYEMWGKKWLTKMMQRENYMS